MTYDEIGNPTAIGEAALSWNGRQLQRVVDSGNTYSYAYNIDGQRVSKTVTQTNNTTTTTEFFYNGSTLAGQKTGENTLVLMYDNNGDAFGFTYNGTQYYYLKNMQGDVDAIVDTNRQIVAKYAYDAWGKVVSVTDADGVEITDNTHIGHINPLRYRSYYYDQESNFYYLNSRYYAPDICRFLNADGTIGANQDIHAYNLFAYCSNNPANFCDPTGESLLTAIGAALGAIAPYVPWILAFTAVAIVGIGLLTIVNAPTINDGITTGIENAVETVNDAIDNAKERSRERTAEKTREKNKNTSYWSAEIIDGIVTPIQPMSYSEARLWVAMGNNLLCKDRAAAIAIVKFYPSAEWDPAHRDEANYLNHYHLNGAHGNHIWYYGE